MHYLSIVCRPVRDLLYKNVQKCTKPCTAVMSTVSDFMCEIFYFRVINIKTS